MFRILKHDMLKSMEPNDFIYSSLNFYVYAHFFILFLLLNIRKYAISFFNRLFNYLIMITCFNVAYLFLHMIFRNDII